MLLITRRPGQGIVISGVVQLDVQEIRGELAFCEAIIAPEVRAVRASIGFLAAGEVVPALSPEPFVQGVERFVLRGPPNTVLSLDLSDASVGGVLFVVRFAVLSVSPSKVKIGIDRPAGHTVLRSETYQELRASNAQSAMRSNPLLPDAVAAALRYQVAGLVPAGAKGPLNGADTSHR